LRRVLKEKGLEYPKDYSLVNVGGSGPSLIALNTGNVAAGILRRAAQFSLSMPFLSMRALLSKRYRKLARMPWPWR
jgi:hypothetical protein